jgi:hypothetical protein
MIARGFRTLAAPDPPREHVKPVLLCDVHEWHAGQDNGIFNTMSDA